MRAVLDTNILVRCTKNSTGPARECLAQLESRQHTLLVSAYLLAELARVLTYPRLGAKHKLSPEEIHDFLVAVEAVGDMVQTPQDAVEGVVTADPDDDPVVQLAVAGRAEVLCTLDQHIRKPAVRTYCEARGIDVLTDVELLGRLKTSGATDPQTPPSSSR